MNKKLYAVGLDFFNRLQCILPNPNAGANTACESFFIDMTSLGSPEMASLWRRCALSLISAVTAELALIVQTGQTIIDRHETAACTEVALTQQLILLPTAGYNA